MSIPKVSLELPFGTDFAAIYCPVCGKAIHDQESSPSCPHVLFSYISEVGDFDYITPNVRDIIDSFDELPEEELEDLDVVGEVVERIESKTAYCLEITSGGMACGPVWSTFWIGIDFDPLASEESGLNGGSAP